MKKIEEDIDNSQHQRKNKEFYKNMACLHPSLKMTNSQKKEYTLLAVVKEIITKTL